MKLLKTKKVWGDYLKVRIWVNDYFFNPFKFNIKHQMKSFFQYSISIITDLRQTFFPS